MSPRVTPGSKTTSEPSTTKLTGKYPSLLSLTTLKGFKVYNEEGKEVGQIEDALFDYQSGLISCLLVSFGGFMGLGEKLFALPWKSVSIDQKTGKCTMHIHLDRLQKAPGLDKGNLPQIHDSEWVKGIYQHYGM